MPLKGHIPKDVIERVLAAHDIAEIVGRYVPLKAAGRSMKALCPFHEEKTPSFTVNRERQTYKCFGCGRGGNVFGFLMEKEGLKFPEVVRALAAERAIPIPDDGPRDPEATSRLEGIRTALDLAQALFAETLASPAGEATRTYLEHRGFPWAAAREMGLGLSPDRWDGLLEAARRKGISGSVLEDAGLVIPKEGGRHYDRFRRRLMFPIRDQQGRVVTSRCRAMRPDDSPKYLNGPETAVFKKGRTLYGLDRAKDGIRKARQAILMEGYTDVLMAHLHGVTSAVAGMGTAFTPEQARLLRRFAERVVLLYDGDAAGRAAAEKSLDVLLEEGLEVRIALLPEGKDVDEVLIEEGVERLEAILASALDLFDFKLEAWGRRADLGSVVGKARAAEDLASSAARVKSEVERDLLFRKIAERLGVDEKVVRGHAAAGGGASGVRRPAAPAAPAAAASRSKEEERRVRDRRRQQQWLVAGAVFESRWVAEVRSALSPEDISADDPGLASLWRACLALADENRPSGPQELARRVAGDPEAAAALASLPGPDDVDVRFDDWVPETLAWLRRTREAEDRRRAVVEPLRQTYPPSASSPQHGESGPSAAGSS